MWRNPYRGINRLGAWGPLLANLRISVNKERMMGFQQRVSLRRTVRFACAAALSLSWLAVFAPFPIRSQRRPVCSSLDESIARADQVVVHPFAKGTAKRFGHGHSP